MAGTEPAITVEVVYALPERQSLVALTVGRRATAREAVALSGLPLRHPDIDLARISLGIFGKRAQPDALLKNGDRVEIYRPLIADPKEARRRRARKRK